jgi:hypothetical protein
MAISKQSDGGLLIVDEVTPNKESDGFYSMLQTSASGNQVQILITDSCNVENEAWLDAEKIDALIANLAKLRKLLI